ncbi:MAG: SDR family NAD(P)-dependent oxidoreductase, partial [Actinobacteria bacterium]
MTDNSSEFGGRVALITGAGTGIGRTTARRLAAGGAQVVVTDKHEGRMRETTDQLTDAFPQTA